MGHAEPRAGTQFQFPISGRGYILHNKGNIARRQPRRSALKKTEKQRQTNLDDKVLRICMGMHSK